jgi:hypothetical protein
MKLSKGIIIATALNLALTFVEPIVSTNIAAQNQVQTSPTRNANRQTEDAARDALYRQFYEQYEAARQNNNDYRYLYPLAKRYLERYGNVRDEKTEYVATFVAWYEEAERQRQEAERQRQEAQRRKSSKLLLYVLFIIFSGLIVFVLFRKYKKRHTPKIATQIGSSSSMPIHTKKEGTTVTNLPLLLKHVRYENMYEGDLIVTHDVIYYLPHIDLSEKKKDIAGKWLSRAAGRGLLERWIITSVLSSDQASAYPNFSEVKFRETGITCEEVKAKLDLFISELKQNRKASDFSTSQPIPFRFQKDEISQVSLTAFGVLSFMASFDRHTFNFNSARSLELYDYLAACSYK